MDMQRTIRLRLRPSRDVEAVFETTLAQYTRCFNDVCRVGFDARCFSGVQLHHETYKAHRESTDLPSQLVISARMKATEALKSVREIDRKRARLLKAREAGKKVRVPRGARCPQSAQCAIRYDARSLNIWWDRCEATIATVAGRQTLRFSVPEALQPYTSWDRASADLLRDRQGRWWLHVVMKAAAPIVPETDEVLGVDLGIAVPAMDSEGRAYGNDHWKIVEDRYEEHRRALQSKGSKSAKRRLKKISGRQRRFRRDCDHVLSEQIVSSVSPGGVIAMEDLTDIRTRVRTRKKQRRRLHGWSFAQLQGFVQYKALARGVRVEYVDPRYTSQKCSECDHREKGNRPSRAVFRCKRCGFECHADHNAARNIRGNYRASKG